MSVTMLVYTGAGPDLSCDSNLGRGLGSGRTPCMVDQRRPNYRGTTGARMLHHLGYTGLDSQPPGHDLGQTWL